jgi:signal transduction histidine kinase
MNHIAESALATVRRVSAELRPGILDALGLPAAVDWLVRDFERRSEIRCSLLIEPEEIEAEQNLATDVFRVLQEALTNVARHARASSLQVTLRQNEGMLELEVADDGIGISEEEISRPDSLGLLGIRERLLVHGGAITVRRLPGKGTCLSVAIPTQGKEGFK